MIHVKGTGGGVNIKDATATVEDVLLGKTFYAGADKNIKTGTIPIKAAATITPGTAAQTIAAGQYLSGAQTIAAIPNEYKRIAYQTGSAMAVSQSTPLLTVPQTLEDGRRLIIMYVEERGGTIYGRSGLAYDVDAETYRGIGGMGALTISQDENGDFVLKPAGANYSLAPYYWYLYYA